jgi:hypothetical protein
MEERGERLKIFDIKHEKAPTLAQIKLSLIEAEDDSNNTSTVVNWISAGIKAQNNQWVFFTISY